MVPRPFLGYRLELTSSPERWSSLFQALSWHIDWSKTYIGFTILSLLELLDPDSPLISVIFCSTFQYWETMPWSVSVGLFWCLPDFCWSTFGSFSVSRWMKKPQSFCVFCQKFCISRRHEKKIKILQKVPSHRDTSLASRIFLSRSRKTLLIVFVNYQRKRQETGKRMRW